MSCMAAQGFAVRLTHSVRRSRKPVENAVRRKKGYLWMNAKYIHDFKGLCQIGSRPTCLRSDVLFHSKRVNSGLYAYRFSQPPDIRLDLKFSDERSLFFKKFYDEFQNQQHQRCGVKNEVENIYGFIQGAVFQHQEFFYGMRHGRKR